MRALRTVLAREGMPRCNSQRSTTWPTLLPCRSPMAASSGCWNRPLRPSAKGAQACGTMARLCIQGTECSCWWKGFISI
ncbi:hypothetical protein D3C80_2051460 [compost metagenome]